jgi:hypothetical protein
MAAADELKRLEREIEGLDVPARAVSEKQPALPAAKAGKPRSSFDLILAITAFLTIAGGAVNTIREMPDQQAKSLRDGLLGGACGLVVGYAVGRLRPWHDQR